MIKFKRAVAITVAVLITPMILLLLAVGWDHVVAGNTTDAIIFSGLIIFLALLYLPLYFWVLRKPTRVLVALIGESAYESSTNPAPAAASAPLPETNVYKATTRSALAPGPRPRVGLSTRLIVAGFIFCSGLMATLALALLAIMAGGQDVFWLLLLSTHIGAPLGLVASVVFGLILAGQIFPNLCAWVESQAATKGLIPGILISVPVMGLLLIAVVPLLDILALLVVPICALLAPVCGGAGGMLGIALGGKIARPPIAAVLGGAVSTVIIPAGLFAGFILLT